MDSCHGNPSPSDPMESVCRHFPPPPQLYFPIYFLSLSRTDSPRSDGFLQQQPVSIGSDGVRLPTFSTPSSTILSYIFTKSLANRLAAVRWILAAARLHRIRWSPFADICCIFAKSLHSPRSDGFFPRQPVSIGSDGVRLPTFSTPTSTILCGIFARELTRRGPMDSCHGNPSPSDPMESVCRHFPPPPQLYFAVYLLSLSRPDSPRSDGFLPRQPVSIGSDGVRLPTFSTPTYYTLLYIC